MAGLGALITRRSRKPKHAAKARKRRVLRRQPAAKGGAVAPAPNTGTTPAKGRKAPGPKPRAVAA